MRETSWKDCIENISARKITPNIKRANSLIETAKERIILIKKIQ